MGKEVDISKLPKWARDHIEDLQRDRDIAVRALNAYVDQQTKSPIFIDEMECIGEKCGPSLKRRYVQANGINIEAHGVHLHVLIREDHLDLQWSSSGSRRSDIAMIPTSNQKVRLVSHSNMER